jgi:hypothetical protein
MIQPRQDTPPPFVAELRYGHPLKGDKARAVARWLVNYARREPAVKLPPSADLWLRRVMYGKREKEELPAVKPLAAARKRLAALERLDKAQPTGRLTREQKQEAKAKWNEVLAELVPKRREYPLTSKRFRQILFYVSAEKKRHLQRQQVTLTLHLGLGGLRIDRPR